MKKKFKNLEKNKENIEAKRALLSDELHKDSVPKDPPVDQRVVEHPSIAFVTLEDPILRNKILQADRVIKAKKRLSCGNHPLADQGILTINPAPRRDQIFWAKSAVSFGSQLCKQFTVDGVCVLIFLALIYILSQIQDALAIVQSNKDELTKNSFLTIYTTLKIGYELTFKAGSYISNKLGKLSAGIVRNQFNSTSLLILSVLKFSLFMFSAAALNDDGKKTHTEVGIKVFFILVTDSLIQGFMKLTGLAYTYSKIAYFCLRSKIQKRKLIMTQKELDENFAMPECVIGYLCCIKLSFMFIASAHAPTSFSLVALPCLFYLVLSLPVDRIILQRFYAEPNPRDIKVFQEFPYYFSFVISVYFTAAIGEWADEIGEMSQEIDSLWQWYTWISAASVFVIAISRWVYELFYSYIEGKVEISSSKIRPEKEDFSVDTSELGASLEGSMVRERAMM